MIKLGHRNPSARFIQFHLENWAPQVPVGGFIGSSRNLSASPTRTMTSSMYIANFIE